MAAPKGHPKYPGAGRRPGTPNKATAEIKAIALKAAPEAMAELLRLSLNAESEQTRVSAIKEIFDRGFGRASAAPEDTDEAVGRVVRFLTGFSNLDGGPKRG